MNNSTINIRPFHAEDRAPLVQAAQEDAHAVVHPSFVYEKNGELVGYFSLVVPMVLTWQHSKKMTVTDSLKGLGFIEGVLATAPFVCFPCNPESRYMGFLPKQGYQPYPKLQQLFIKSR